MSRTYSRRTCLVCDKDVSAAGVAWYNHCMMHVRRGEMRVVKLLAHGEFRFFMTVAGQAVRRRRMGRCGAVIYHGPGHQSHTFCQITGPHEEHEATYGRHSQFACWTGDEVFSGYFDEPPEGAS